VVLRLAWAILIVCLVTVGEFAQDVQPSPIAGEKPAVPAEVRSAEPPSAKPLEKTDEAAPPAGRNAPVSDYKPRPQNPGGFDWRSAVKQSLTFLAVQHSYALTQPKTRESLRGPFFRDYLRSVKSLHGWADGGRFFTNYIAHPMQGSFMGYIQVQNDAAGRHERFGSSTRYWKSRAKALGWSAAWSTQFEIGPISQASIGNVGLKGKQTWVDIVVTPTVGTAMLVTEDALDRFLISRLERSYKGWLVRILARMLLNPTRSVANAIRMKKPWYRDDGLR
jgi:hypothetical protein